MFSSNYDLSNKKENEKEKNINVNLYNRKYNLLKLKNIYQSHINQMIIKIENIQKMIKDDKIKTYNNQKIINIKNEIKEIKNKNKELEKKNRLIEKENEKLEEFFNDFFDKNNKFNVDENGLKRKKNKINIGVDEQLIDIFGLEENNKILAYKKNKLFE